MDERNISVNQRQSQRNLRVSVIIPSFNAAKYLPECLDGVFNQSLKPLEIIVVDDGSTDNTREVLRSDIETGRVKYFYQENQGPGTARNLGISKSLGELVAFCDADDLWLPEKLEKQIPLFKNPETALVYSDMEIFKGDDFAVSQSNRVKHDNQSKYSEVNKVKGFYRGSVFNELLKENFISASTVVVRRRVIEDSGGFPRGRKFFSVEDYICWLAIAKEHEVDFIDEPLVKYRWHENNISHQSKKESYQRLVDVYAFLVNKYGPLPIVLWKYLESRLKIILS